MSTLHEQARSEAEKRWPDTTALTTGGVKTLRRVFSDGFLAGHEAATRTRAVTTVTELDALPVGSVVLNDRGVAWQKRGANHRWYCAGLPSGIKAVPYLPARVLYEPEEGR